VEKGLESVGQGIHECVKCNLELRYQIVSMPKQVHIFADCPSTTALTHPPLLLLHQYHTIIYLDIFSLQKRLHEEVTEPAGLLVVFQAVNVARCYLDGRAM